MHEICISQDTMAKFFRCGEHVQNRLCEKFLRIRCTKNLSNQLIFWLSYSKNIKWTFLLWHSVETASDAKPLQTQHDAILTGRRRTGSTLLTCQLLSGTVYSFAPFRQNSIILSKFWSPVGSCATQVVLEYRPLNAWLFTYLFFCSFHAMHTHTV